jgi:phytoene dehydrogenase-like protein
MVSTELIEAADAAGVTITAGTKIYQISFSKTGTVGGHIRMALAGKTVVDQDLVDHAADDYAGWRDDPRYDEWMKNPQMRTTIGADPRAYR